MSQSNPQGFHTATCLSKQDDVGTGAELHEPGHRCLSEARQAQEWAGWWIFPSNSALGKI